MGRVWHKATVLTPQGDASGFTLNSRELRRRCAPHWGGRWQVPLAPNRDTIAFSHWAGFSRRLWLVLTSLWNYLHGCKTASSDSVSQLGPRVCSLRLETSLDIMVSSRRWPLFCRNRVSLAPGVGDFPQDFDKSGLEVIQLR